jgi:adenosylcobinamide-phosphate synthase
MTFCAVLVFSFLLDLCLGDPVYRLHPVRLIGGLIDLFERCLRNLHLSGVVGGALLAAGVAVVSAGLYLAVFSVLYLMQPELTVVLGIYTVYSCIALRDMLMHVSPVNIALWQSDVVEARRHLSVIVGRDVSVLDAYAIARATVESVAESFVDGFFAPVFWFTFAGVAGGLCGLPVLAAGGAAVVVYRSINTLDSMVGYRNQRYLYFGRVSAGADDVLNFVPARLALFSLWLSAAVLRLAPQSGIRVALRDRLKHASPNSAHAESFAAGALGVRLGGPTVYAHGTVDKPWLGDGTKDVLPHHIQDVCRLVLLAGGITVVFAVAIAESVL